MSKPKEAVVEKAWRWFKWAEPMSGNPKTIIDSEAWRALVYDLLVYVDPEGVARHIDGLYLANRVDGKPCVPCQKKKGEQGG